MLAMFLSSGPSALVGAAVASNWDSRTDVTLVDTTAVDAIREFVETERERWAVPGISVAIVSGDELVFAEGFGESRVSEAVMTADTVTLVASLSKSITALTLLTFVDEGLVDLDDPVSDYVPELAPGGDAVTLRDLMHHRSGIPKIEGTATFVGDMGSSLERSVIRLEPLLEPYAEHVYSNANYDALALVMERVAGRPFPEVVSVRVFEPLGMTSSAAGPAGADLPNRATGYYHRLLTGFGPHEPWMPAGMAGSYTMFSSANDLARLMAVHLGNGTVELVSSESLAVLHEAAQYGPEDWPVGYAGGLRVFEAGRFPFPGRLGELTMLAHDGSSPSYASAIAMLPDVGIGVVVLANGNNTVNESLISQIADNITLLLLGEPTFQVTVLSEGLDRWNKHLLALLVALQLMFAAVSGPTLSRLRRKKDTKWWEWPILGAATALDLAVLVVMIFIIPAVGDTPLRVVRSLPDYGILITLLALGIGWGVLRSALAGYWAFAGKRRQPTDRRPDQAPA